MDSHHFGPGVERINANIASINALASLLRSVAQDPKSFANDIDLRAALRSQGALAKYANDPLKICSMSLNHQKKVCVSALGDFMALDRLRREAADSLSRYENPPKSSTTKSRAGLIQRIEELEKDRLTLLEDLFLLQRAYDLRCLQARSYAQSADDATKARCSKEQREIDASFSLRRKKIDSGKVVGIRGERARGETS